MADTVKGTVRWFDNGRGYGFITLDNDKSGAEYFVHYSSIVMEGYKTLTSNQPVSLQLVNTDKGIQAAEVRPI